MQVESGFVGRHDTKGNSVFRFLLSLFGLADFVHWITTICTSLETGRKMPSSEDSHANISAFLPVVGKGLMLFFNVV